MIRFTLYCLALCLAACSAPSQPSSTVLPQAQLQRQVDSRLPKIADVPSGPKTYTLNCVSNMVCWTGDLLNQWRTDDGGGNWQPAYSGKPNGGEIRNLNVIDGQVAWVLTIEHLYKTEDGGRSWIPQTSPLPDYPLGELRTIRFLKDGIIAWAGGGTYRHLTRDEKVTGVPRNLSDPPSNTVLRPAISHTEDGGKTWIPQSIPSTLGRVYDLAFQNEQHGLALESSGPFHTTNGGKQWKRVDFKKSCTDERYLEGYDMSPLEVFFLDSQSAWLTFEDGRIAKSSDGGKSWCDLLAPNAVKFDYHEKYFRKIHFATPSNGWGLGANGLLYETKDGGATWMKVSNNEFDDLFFLNDQHGWLVSKDGLFQISPSDK